MEHPIIESIRQIQEQSRTGSLPLEKGSRTIILCFRDGLIQAAGSDIAELRLGNILTKKGILKTSSIPQLLEKARRKHMILGKAAVQTRLLDDTELQESVTDQIIQALTYALNNEFRVGLFDETPVNLYMPAKLDVDYLILELARKNLVPFQLDPNSMLSLNNGRNLSHFPWYPQELSVLSRLKEPCSLQELAISTGMEYARLNKILSVFNSLNLLKEVETAHSESTAVVKRDRFPFEHLIPEIGNSALSSKLETFHNPTSFISEQFKTLKVKLAEAAAQAPLRVIAVSSPHTEDGKSLVCSNLAVSLSKDPGRRVVVVDCDLRNPSIHKFLGTSVEPGLLGYLEGDYLQAYCYMRRLDKLYLMTAGGISENPIELLSNVRMQELIAELKTEFDTIILDCPPFGPISDAQILTGLADGFLMVVRCGKTTYGTMEKAFKILDKSKLIGLIFNDVKPMMFNTQYHYKYYNYRNRAYPYGTIKITHRPKNYLE
ncbi:MAG: polysaccharide biosynthesis tyrosine autokinase [Acidobacteria bacterium]|nr:polysaccharide biosynthesis tyrosine autokinase [Acidobacteriota bacterium]